MIKHKSSFIDISFDYCFEATKSRKILRIMVTIKNVSNFTLRDVTSTIDRDNIKILTVQP
jgi:hypothetical protein